LGPKTIGGAIVAAYTYPLLDLFWSMLWFFLFILWIWLLVVIFTDIFRSHDIGGWAKALWVIFIIVLPFLGVFVYLIARGGKMQERAGREAVQQQEAFDKYVRETAHSGGSADELVKLAGLRDRGVITDAEFQTQKAKLLT
jgi:type VI protein secretion system component VasK